MPRTVRVRSPYPDDSAREYKSGRGLAHTGASQTRPRHLAKDPEPVSRPVGPDDRVSQS